MSVTTPNMNLIQPTINVDSGLTWEQSMNSNASILDNHNHTSGNGVQIPPAGLNINTALPFNNNQATGLQASVYSAQASLATLLATYVIGNDLYYNDGAGNVIRVTSGGAVNATSSGISSGTASAAFSAGVLVVNSGSNTPANIQGASILLGNNTTGSNYLTLSPPSAMASNISQTLPTIPGSKSYITMDSSGNMSTALPYAANKVISASSGVYSTASTSLTAVTNMSVSITTTGNPVMLYLQDDGSLSGNGSNVSVSSTNGILTYGNFAWFRGSTQLTQMQIVPQNSASGYPMPAGNLLFMDSPAAGTYTYTLKVKCSGSSTGIQVYYQNMVAYELK